MKYANLILYLVVSLISVNAVQVNAQSDFAPIGAKWYYDFSVYGSEGYFTLESVRDTLILEKECKIIKHQSISFDYTLWPAQQIIDTVHLDNRILCFENNVVYHYFDSMFYKLIDFNAEVSDKWTLKIPEYFPDCDTTIITVDSVYQQLINGTELKTLLVNQPEDANVGFAPFSYVELLERIGPPFYLFGMSISENSSSCGVIQTGGLGIGKLRCYSDDVIGMVKFGETDCDFVVDSFYLSINESINAQMNQVEIKAYPNPTVDKLFFELDQSTNFDKILFFDINGRVMKKVEIIGNTPIVQIDVNDFPSNVYFWKIGNQSGKFFVD